MSDIALDLFDEVAAWGDKASIADLKDFYSDHFDRWNRYQVTTPITSIEITESIVRTGKLVEVDGIVRGFLAIHPDAMVRVEDGTIEIFKWKEAKDLRSAWKNYAEIEYKRRLAETPEPSLVEAF